MARLYALLLVLGGGCYVYYPPCERGAPVAGQGVTVKLYEISDAGDEGE